MNYPRYFVEIDSITRAVLAAHIITFNAHLEQGNTLTSSTSGCEMLEISPEDIANIPDFPEVVGTYKLDDDNKLVPV